MKGVLELHRKQLCGMTLREGTKTARHGTARHGMARSLPRPGSLPPLHAHHGATHRSGACQGTCAPETSVLPS